METKRMKTNVAHWAILLDFMEEHPKMLTHNFVGLDGRLRYNNLWADLSNQLNCMGYGAKTPKNWIQAFTKWKSKVKAKAQEIRCGMKKTGGGGPLPNLNENEQRLMALVGWKIVDGDSCLELGLDISVTDRPMEHDFQSTSGTVSYLQKSNSTSNRPLKKQIDATNKALEPLNEHFIGRNALEEMSVSSQPPLIYNTPSKRDSSDKPLPKLIVWNKEKNIKLHTDDAPLISKEQDSATTVPKENESKTNQKIATKKTKTPKYKINRHHQETSLTQMHSDTLTELKNINTNIVRLAESHKNQTEILKKLTNILETFQKS